MTNLCLSPSRLKVKVRQPARHAGTGCREKGQDTILLQCAIWRKEMQTKTTALFICPDPAAITLLRSTAFHGRFEVVLITLIPVFQDKTLPGILVGRPDFQDLESTISRAFRLKYLNHLINSLHRELASLLLFYGANPVQLFRRGEGSMIETPLYCSDKPSRTPREIKHGVGRT